MDRDYIYQQGGEGSLSGNDTFEISLRTGCRLFEFINTSDDSVLAFRTNSMSSFSIPIDAKDANVLPLNKFTKVTIKIISGSVATFKWQAYSII